MREDAVVAIAWWALVGALGAFVVAALFSVGVFFMPVLLLLGGVGLWSRRLRPGVLPGVLLGASLLPLWLAFQNRSGPGTVCESTATSSTCTEQYSPWPFLLVGLLLAGAGVALARRSVREAAVTPARVEVPGPT